MDDLTLLYQQMILDHSRNPRFFTKNEVCTKNTCYNPLCGDEISIYLQLEGERIMQLSFQGKGCAICIASASLMCETLQNRSVVEVQDTFKWFQALVSAAPAPDNAIAIKKLEVLKGVSQYPMRVKCATCSWHALLDGIKVQKKE